jgi:two-component system response regulator VicR
MSNDSDKRDQKSRKHIFIINTDPVFLKVARLLLQEEGYDITTTSFIPLTFEQIAALQPNLLIIDLTIGQKAGWNLLEKLQEEAITRKIPVIVVSTNQQLLDQAKTNQQRYGVSYFIAMPFDIHNLLDAIKSLLI